MSEDRTQQPRTHLPIPGAPRTGSITYDAPALLGVARQVHEEAVERVGDGVQPRNEEKKQMSSSSSRDSGRPAMSAAINVDITSSRGLAMWSSMARSN